VCSQIHVVVAPVVVEMWARCCRDVGTNRGWTDRSRIISYHGSHAPVHCARSRTSHSRRWMSWWRPTWLPVAPEGLTRPSGEAEVCRGGQALPCLRHKGQARQRLFPTGQVRLMPSGWIERDGNCSLSLGWSTQIAPFTSFSWVSLILILNTLSKGQRNGARRWTLL
jgi:hypothetical protein